MKLLVFLFALLTVVAMAVMPVSANNPMCNEAPQSGGGYKIHEIAAAQRNAIYGQQRNLNSNYGSTKNYNRNVPRF